MGDSNRGGSSLMTIWLMSAVFVALVFVTLLIVSDQKDRAEKKEQEEMYKQYSTYNTGNRAGNNGNQVSNSGTAANTGNGVNGNDGSAGNSAASAGNGNEEDAQMPFSTPTETPSEPTSTPEPTATPTPTSSAGRVQPDTSRIDPLKPIVALSFDDGPGIYTPRVLDTLKKYNAHATFFMLGDNVTKYPDNVRLIRSSGCEIANHTISHKDLKTLSASEIRKEIDDNQKMINDVLGTTGEQYLVRPPYGNINDTVKENCDHPLVLWTVDTLDWKSKDPQKILQEVKNQVKDGSVILMHEIYQSTAEALEIVLPWLKEQGYQICSVSEMYSIREEYMKDGHIYHYTYTVDEFKKNHENTAAQ